MNSNHRQTNHGIHAHSLPSPTQPERHTEQCWRWVVVDKTQGSTLCLQQLQRLPPPLLPHPPTLPGINIRSPPGCVTGMLAGLKWTGVWNIEDSSTDLLYCAKFNNDIVDVNRQLLSTSMVSRRQEEHKRLPKRERLIQFSSALMNNDRVDVNKQLLSTSMVSRRQEEHNKRLY